MKNRFLIPRLGDRAIYFSQYLIDCARTCAGIACVEIIDWNNNLGFEGDLFSIISGFSSPLHERDFHSLDLTNKIEFARAVGILWAAVTFDWSLRITFGSNEIYLNDEILNFSIENSSMAEEIFTVLREEFQFKIL